MTQWVPQGPVILWCPGWARGVGGAAAGTQKWVEGRMNTLFMH